jgi:hypothetical protein
MSCLAGTIASAPAQANLLDNGNFESGLAGWSAAGSVEARTDEGPSDGSVSAVFNWGNPAVVDGYLAQSFATTPGNAYAVTFDDWGWAAPNEHQFAVAVNGSGVLLTQPLSAIGAMAPVCQTFHATFTADSLVSTLSFIDLTTVANSTNSDFSVDGVSVSAVPEPATGMALLGGLGLLLLKTVRQIRCEQPASQRPAAYLAEHQSS